MKKKISIGIIAIVSILIVFITFNMVKDNINLSRLKAAVGDSNASGSITIICDKTSLNVNETTNCTLKGNLNDSITSVAGKLESTSNLEISEVSKTSNWIGEEGRIINYYSSPQEAGNFDIATFQLKALSSGSGSVTLTKISDTDGDETPVNIGNSEFELVEVPEPTLNIQVTSNTDTRSNVNTLSNLSVTSGTLNPSFNEDVNDYYVLVDNSVTSVTISATATDSSSTITGTGEKQLNVGDNEFDIVVTSERGTPNTYTVSIEREEAIDNSKPSINTLKSLSVSGIDINPQFDSDIIEYSAQVGSSVSKIIINAEPTDPLATVTGTGETTLSEGLNVINVVVTAQSNKKKIYVLRINRDSETGSGTSNNSSSSCKLELTSIIYKIDNQNLTISNVNRDHSLDTIKNNISSECGSIMVSENKVVLSSDTEIKEYAINRVWIPQTGTKVIKYVVIITIILAAITALFIYKLKMNKKDR